MGWAILFLVGVDAGIVERAGWPDSVYPSVEPPSHWTNTKTATVSEIMADPLQMVWKLNLRYK